MNVREWKGEWNRHLHMRSNPITGLERPWGFQEAEAPRFKNNQHMNVVRLSALRTGRLYTPGNIHGTYFCYWSTALEAGRSWVRFPMVSLEFFIAIILPAALWPWVASASNRNEYQEYFLGVKGAGTYSWQPYHLHVPIVLKSGNLSFLEPSGPVQACNGIDLPFTHFC